MRKFKNGESGLGIGLVLVHEIIHLHKGQVLITSEGLGCGSEFSIILPLDTSLPQETLLEAI